MPSPGEMNLLNVAQDIDKSFSILSGRVSNRTGWDYNTQTAMAGCGNASTASDWKCQGYGAANCTFAPCVRTYNASIKAGRLDETLLLPITWINATQNGYTDPSNNESVQSQNQALVDTQCISQHERSSLKSEGYLIDPQTRWLPYNVTFRLNNTDKHPIRRITAQFSISSIDAGKRLSIHDQSNLRLWHCSRLPLSPLQRNRNGLLHSIWHPWIIQRTTQSPTPVQCWLHRF